MTAPRFVVMFSSGAGSWAAARRVADQHGTDGLVLLFTDVAGPTGSPHDGEDPDNYRFLREAAADVGGELVWLRQGDGVWGTFDRRSMIGNTRASTCSYELKQKPARDWIAQHAGPDTCVVVGIGWDEEHRLPSVVKAYAPLRVWAPLTEAPYLDRAAILNDLAARGIQPPALYAQGFAHANCGGFCVRAGHAQFAHLLRVNPDRYAWHEAQEAAFRQKRGKDVAVLRDRRGGTTVPLTLRAFRERQEQGDDQLDLFDVGGCGCFVTD